MSNYSRNGNFLIGPHGDQRDGRCKNADSVAIPSFAPVSPTGTPDDLGRQGYELASAGARGPRSGIAIFEGNAWNEYAGLDPVLANQADIDKAPVGDWLTVQWGEQIKVRLINTADSDFGTSTRKGRTMVAGLGATPTVAVGDYLTPGAGDDSSGYWKETADADEAWLVVTFVDPNGAFVDAETV